MGYYDNVKDSIRDENGDDKEKASQDSEKDTSSNEGISGNFDTLREAAEETEVKEEEGGDGTPIEVLEEEGLKQKAPSKTAQKTSRKEKTSTSKTNTERKQRSRQTQESKKPSPEANGISGDTSDLEDKLDKIIEQNAQMIKILESFGN